MWAFEGLALVLELYVLLLSCRLVGQVFFEFFFVPGPVDFNSAPFLKSVQDCMFAGVSGC